MKTRSMMPTVFALTLAVGAMPVLLSSVARAEVRRDDFRLQADLIEAAMQGQTWQVRALLDKGANVETRDRQSGWTPLMWAARGGHVGTVRFLLARGANVNRRSVGDARTYMTLAEGRTSTTIEPAAGQSSVANSGFSSANNGITPLILAAAGGYNLAARELLNKGADVNARTSSGETALMAAAFNGYLPLVQTLLSHGANVTARDAHNNMALSSAVLQGHTTVVRELLKHGAPANERYMNQTPLVTVAKYFNHTEIANLLTRHSVRQAARSNAAKTGARRVRSANAARTNATPHDNGSANRPGAPAASGPNVIILN
ncbi:MAG: ankyrin repeat protein 17 [Abditibacteriota bacterium]|nr:ankyrin repeat protein 17 [Abditibacteriota bacterium]